MTSYAQRLVRVCHDLLDAGPVGDTIRGDEYRDFIRLDMPADACMRSPSGVVGGDIGKIRTSCAVFAGAASWHAGLPITRMRTWSYPMLGNWYPLTHTSSAWSPFPRGPEPGDVFDLASHVGICLEHLGGGLWRTAEGGGGDGTKCSISERRRFDPHNPRAWDPSMGRALRGVFRAEQIGILLGEGKQAATRTLRLVAPRMVGEDVRIWQRLVGAEPDGVYGPLTERATRDWQRSHALVPDGIVGPLTRAEADL